jgi:hypothetical protein
MHTDLAKPRWASGTTLFTQGEFLREIAAPAEAVMLPAVSKICCV